MEIYFDSEFTGLHEETTLISIGFITDDDRTFYAELTDYDQDQVDEWLQENVLDMLILNDEPIATPVTDRDVVFCGTTWELHNHLVDWFKTLPDEKNIMWSDCYAYDWMLFNGIFGHAFNIPENVLYIPMDLSTLFYVNGIDPDISREGYLCMESDGMKHNALWDAKIIKQCKEKVLSLQNE